ncbi:hypothetical protein ACHRVZ_15585 [Flavobacterium sp. FlaQc-57]|uniref:hypothetical protein n=1 Tax=Flavobacterium sp. FlaQc-57 TaxID=3374186 RepID=UPI0037581EB9
MFLNIKNVALFLIFGCSVSNSSAQEVLKLGTNPYSINERAALDVESTSKGFLPPRMTKVQRNAIVSPPPGLQVWCTDCNVSTEPASGQLCIYMGSAWAPLTMTTTAVVKTGRRTDSSNKPTRTSTTAVTIKGTLVEVSGALPTETGVVYIPITNGDFATLPLLDADGSAIAPNMKTTTSSVVTTEGAAMSVPVSSLGATPYYYRMYAKSYLGIGYGNPMVFNVANPSFSALSVSSPTAIEPTFNGILTVNAGTLSGAVTEYGYYSGTSASPTTNKVILSTPALLADLNAKLNVETFTANPTVTLTVPDFNTASTDQQYFRFYVIASSQVIYSSDISFKPNPDAVTGGSAIATFTSAALSGAPLVIGVDSSGKNIVVTFEVTKTGTYSAFTVGGSIGNTTNITLGGVSGGTWSTTGTKTLNFPLSGYPSGDIDGRAFAVSRIPSVSTGVLTPGALTAGLAACSRAYVKSTIVPVTGNAGKVWMDRNLGAYQSATSSTDHLAYGCLFQWGRDGDDGHASINRASATGSSAVNGTTTMLSAGDQPTSSSFIITSDLDWRSPKNDNLWQGVNGINNPCPPLYRLPTITEFNAEISAGSKITSLATAYSSPLKLIAAGTRTGDTGVVYDETVFGSYWTSSVNAQYAIRLRIDSSTALTAAIGRAYGFSVRCVKN